MVSLKPPPVNWEDAILEAAIQFMNAEVCFYEEGEPTDRYDPKTGLGGDADIRILWRGKARVQHIRAPRQFDTDYQADATRFVRYQLDPNDLIPALPFGTKSRVFNGGRDPILESLVLVVISAINSSHRAVRTVELSTNMEFVEWDWEPADRPYGYGYGPYGDSV